MKIFLASSFAYVDPQVSALRKEAIIRAADILKRRGFDVYVPHLNEVENAWEMSNYDWAMAVASEDKTEILQSDTVVLLTYGKEKNNAGVSFESGFVDGVNLYRVSKGEKPIRLVLVKMNEEIESLMMWSASTLQIRGVEALETLDFDATNVLKDVELS